MVDILKAPPERGPVEMLCREIGEPFDRRLERPEMLLAFTRQMVAEVGEMIEFCLKIGHITGDNVTKDAARAIAVCWMMVEAQSVAEARALAEEVHDIYHAAGEDAVDRHLELLSACASAVRFGLEKPCNSRHAAHACNDIWARKYGVRLWDRCTPEWQKSWARQLFHGALSTAAISAWSGKPVL